MNTVVSYRRKLKTQIREAYGRLVYTYTAHWKQIDRLVSKNNRIKASQIVLSAISTGGFIGTAISDQIFVTWIGGIVSTILLAINLYFKDFSIAVDIKMHRKAADDLWLVREKYISLLTDFDDMSEELIIQKRDELQKLTSEIYQQAPPIDNRSYNSAKKALQKDEEQFFRAVEIDKILPEHLREVL